MWNGIHTKTYNLNGPNYNKMLINNSLCYFTTRVVYAQITVTCDKGIKMRVFVFGLFFGRTSLMESWPKLVQLVLPVFSFIQFYRFYVSLEDNWCCLICFTYCLLTNSYMPVLMTRFSIHALLIRIYRYTCACRCTPLGIRHTTRWGVLTPLHLRVQILELGSRWTSWWSELHSVASWIISWPSGALSFQAPLLVSRVFLL